MHGPKSIVVGVDFTPGSGAAIREALRLAQWNRGAVHAVHIIDTLVAAELEESLSPFLKSVRESLMADARRAWQSFARQLDGASGVPLELQINNRIAGILSAAREHKADLLVLGAYGEKGPDVGLGTLATACVRHAMSNVLLVRDRQSGPFKTVLACVDFSPTSLAALDQAARVAAQDGAALHVVHVFDAPWHRLHYRAPTPEADPRFQEQYRQLLQRRLVEFSGELGREINYVHPTFTLFDHQGHRSGIVEYAQKVHADLVVLGTRGKTNLRDLLMGSTAEKALRESTCSVLAIKPEGFTHPLATGEGQPQAQMRGSA